jgi:hypothetical protein
LASNLGNTFFRCKNAGTKSNFYFANVLRSERGCSSTRISQIQGSQNLFSVAVPMLAAFHWQTLKPTREITCTSRFHDEEQVLVSSLSSQIRVNAFVVAIISAGPYKPSMMAVRN